jgi:hypothetical protein
MLTIRLEKKSALEWLFEFWDNDDKSRIQTKNGWLEGRGG